MASIKGVGIIGAGKIFKEHARAYQSLSDRARIVAIADNSATQLDRATCEFFIPAAFRDYRDLLLRPDVDLVDICTPPAAHEEMIVAALQAGKYVICEKPLAPSLAAVDRILEATKGYEDRLAVVHQLRTVPEVERITWLRDTGQLGRLRYGVVRRYGHFLPGVHATDDWWGDWEIAGGGALMTQFIHELDLVLHLFGTPTDVTARMATLTRKVVSEDTVAATISFADGAMVTCTCTLAAHGFESSVDVFGESASVHIPWAFRASDARVKRSLARALARRFPAPARITLPAPLDEVIGKVRRRLLKQQEPSLHAPFLRAVLDAIDAGQPLPVGPAQARRSIELCTAIYTSALTGERVRLPLTRATPYYHGVTRAAYDGRQRSAEVMETVGVR